MALARWSPWRELEEMQRSLSRLLGETGVPATEEGVWLPAVDIRETDDALIVEAELPGIERKDVKVDIKDGVLTISGERKYEKETEEENVHRMERVYGRFTRSFSLPNNVDVDKVEAKLKDGVLRIRLPKKETARARTVEIK